MTAEAKYSLIGRIMTADAAISYPKTGAHADEVLDALLRCDVDTLEAHCFAIERQADQMNAYDHKAARANAGGAAYPI